MGLEQYMLEDSENKWRIKVLNKNMLPIKHDETYLFISKYEKIVGKRVQNVEHLAYS